MQRLTFKGYLQVYVPYLAGEKTASLTRLSQLAKSNSRLMGPLLLWAVTTEREGKLGELLQDRPDATADLLLLGALQRRGRLESALESHDPQLRPQYLKAWKSYVVRRDAHKRDSELKLEARERVLALETDKHVTRYRMARDLNLNHGNLHAFLSKGDPSKLSLHKAHELVDYLEAA